MKKPIILTVDDDPDVLSAVSRDIRREFGDRFRVVRVDSGQRALDVLRQVKLANDSVALMIADQRMPGLTGVEFLEEALPLFPKAKRALLTAYADIDAAISAINDVHIDYYLMKPWDPPEDRLFPVLDDLLDDWLAAYRPAFEGLRIIGHRWSAECHSAREFLARNQVPHRWLDIASNPEARELLDVMDPKPATVPVLVFPDGSVLTRPTNQEIAERVGLRSRAEVPLYDLIIVGAGPAGLAAAVYATSEGLKTAIVERHAAGGQAGTSSLIENYLGFPSGLSGDDLARRALTQARRFGTEFLLTHEVTDLDATDGSLTLTMNDGSAISAHSVIIATGVAYRKLAVPEVDRLLGKGIYHGAARSAAEGIAGEDVYIVGGANSAGQAAMNFASVANSVTMLVRGTSLSASMSQYLVERIERTPNILVRYQTEVERVIGDAHLEGLLLRNNATGENEQVITSSLFVFIGAVPPTQWLGDKVLRDDRGFLLTGPDLVAHGKPRSWPDDRDPLMLETSIPGLFAAGDVRHGSGKRVATAVGEGAMAVLSVWQLRALQGL